MAWQTGDPWPGTPGGASSPAWSDRLRLYVWAAIQAGTTMHWGPHANDRVDAGNVWSAGTPPSTAPPAPTGTLWVDLTCDVLAVETRYGGQRGDGVLARAEAATCQLSLRDPNRIYDPLNPDSPFQYGGRSRLMPGVPLIVFAELLGAADALTQRRLFTGTVDLWSEPWTPRPASRRANVIASDGVKDLVALDRGEQPAVGAGDTVDQRIARICTYYAWNGTRRLDASNVVEQATTLAQSAWELIGRATDDEVGFTYIDTNGTLQFLARSSWATTNPPKATLGCSPGETSLDIITDAKVAAPGAYVRNAIYAARTGGTTQVARSDPSILQNHEKDLKRTDLGHNSDTITATWATTVLSLAAWPRARIESVTILPHLDPASWAVLLNLALIVDRLHIVWTPPDATTAYETTGRVAGVGHSITFTRWETELSLVLADLYGRVMHWGPHPQDRVNAGNVYAPGG